MRITPWAGRWPARPRPRGASTRPKAADRTRAWWCAGQGIQDQKRSPAAIHASHRHRADHPRCRRIPEPKWSMASSRSPWRVSACVIPSATRAPGIATSPSTTRPPATAASITTAGWRRRCIVRPGRGNPGPTTSARTSGSCTTSRKISVRPPISPLSNPRSSRRCRRSSTQRPSSTASIRSTIVPSSA